MRPFLILPLLALPACDMASPEFYGAEKMKRTHEGSKFTLRRKGDVMEVIRTSPEMLPRFENVARKAAFVAEAETGCTTAWVIGDPAMMTMGMACEGRNPPPKPKRKPKLDCVIFSGDTIECDIN